MNHRQYNNKNYITFQGTGKTRTLAAAVEEILRSSTKSVLVCVHSNTACDEITERLLKVLHTNELFRIYANSCNKDAVSETIRPHSNYHHQFKLPSLDFLYQFRVIICTLTTAGCLTRARRERNFDSSHFSHVFIDEAACVHETVAMIPIAGELVFVCVHHYINFNF